LGPFSLLKKEEFSPLGFPLQCHTSVEADFYQGSALVVLHQLEKRRVIGKKFPSHFLFHNSVHFESIWCHKAIIFMFLEKRVILSLKGFDWISSSSHHQLDHSFILKINSMSKKKIWHLPALETGKWMICLWKGLLVPYLYWKLLHFECVLAIHC